MYLAMSAIRISTLQHHLHDHRLLFPERVTVESLNGRQPRHHTQYLFPGLALGLVRTRAVFECRHQATYQLEKQG